ncbi:NUDIX hydrolase [Marinilabilia rubra]|uniref:NUDIX hydrolase n=1 Tax=Marinilabilia rubra TaxID=2162893 RepID=A0A2U2B6B7_9BACT|nr:NUDIX domain-containing protein [Marinilabilia rubra]PWD98584.1 NUDIX hydrolase [Marinilabilia rubra]
MTKTVMNNTISVDCVIFGFDFEKLNVLLVDRELKDENNGEELFSDLTLTGNHIFENESLENAAARVLFDLTGLENIYLKQFGAFCDPGRLKRPNDQAWLRASGRDPESRIISVGYYSLLATENVTLKWKGRNVKWYPVSEVKDLAFDHMVILKSALQALRRELLHEPIGFELLPEKFTLSQLQKLYEVVLDVELDKRNFRKKIARMKYLIALDEKQKGVAHKPARLYMFSREVYEKTRKEVLDFNI